MSISSDRGLVKGTFLILFSRVVGIFLRFFQFSLIAYTFGIGMVTDAYIVAQTIPNLSRGLIENVLNCTFLPVFIAYKDKKGKDDSWIIANTIFFLSFFILIIISVLICLFSPWIISMLAPGLSLESSQLSNYLLRVMSPLLILIFLTLLLTSIFYAYNQFSVPSVTELFPQIGGIISLVLLSHSFGIISLPVGIIVASMIQLIVLFLFLKNYKKVLRPQIAFDHPGVRQVGKLIGPRFVGFSLDSLNLFVDRLFASLLGAGFLSALTYAQTIVLTPHTIVVGSLSRVIMPALSTYSSNNEYEKIKELISKSVRMISFLTIPIIIFICIFREELIRLLFQRGAFTAESTHLTAYALLYYSVSIFAYCTNPILKMVFFAVQDTVTPLKIGILAFVSNAILDFIMMKFLGHGGIALSTSIVATLNTGALWVLLTRKIGAIDKSEIYNSMVKIFLASISVGIILRVAYLNLYIAYNSFFWDLAKISILFIIGGILFFSVCMFLNIQEYKEIAAVVRQRQVKEKDKYKILDSV